MNCGGLTTTVLAVKGVARVQARQCVQGGNPSRFRGTDHAPVGVNKKWRDIAAARIVNSFAFRRSCPWSVRAQHAHDGTLRKRHRINAISFSRSASSAGGGATFEFFRRDPVKPGNGVREHLIRTDDGFARQVQGIARA